MMLSNRVICGVRDLLAKAAGTEVIPRFLDMKAIEAQ